MPQTEKTTEAAEQDELQALGFVPDEIGTEGEEVEEPEAAAEEVVEEEPALKAADEPEPDAEAREDEEDDGDSEGETDFYEAFGKILDTSAAGLEKKTKTAPSPDPRDLELQAARERERQALLDRIEDLKAQRGEPEKAATEADPFETSVEAAVQVLKARGYNEEQVRDFLGAQAELIKIDRETIRERELKPLQEKLAQAEETRTKQETAQRRQQEVITGLQNLASAGPTERKLVEQFVTALNTSPEAAFRSTYLGRTLLLDWDEKGDSIPPNLRSRNAVEMAGRALAAGMERAVKAYRRQGVQTSQETDTEALEASGNPPRRRSARPSKPDSTSATEAALANEIRGEEGSTFAGTFDWYRNADTAFK